jgi:sugar lactone lactonase YvrE
MGELTALLEGLSYTEGPRWHNGHLYFSDFHTHRVLRVDERGKSETLAHVPGIPSGLGFLPDGRLLVVSMNDRKLMRREHDGSLVQHADLSALCPWPLNDMLVDDQGCAWVGNLGYDPATTGPVRATILMRVETDGTAEIVGGDLWSPNGTVLSPNKRTLIISESLGNRLTAFDINGKALTNRRTWALFGPPATSTDVREMIAQSTVTPDGLAIDAEGAIWVADALHQRLLRVMEGGRILQEVQMPDGRSVFAGALGGKDGHTLFLCTARGFGPEAAANHQAAIMTMRVDVPAPRP